MFNIRAHIFNVFMLVLEVSSKANPVANDKSFRVDKILAKKIFKFISNNRNVYPYFKYISTLILCPVSTDIVSKKKNRKQDRVIESSFSCV